MQKRISALLLAMVIVIGSVLGGNTLKVKAASVAVSEDFAVELTMMIYICWKQLLFLPASRTDWMITNPDPLFMMLLLHLWKAWLNRLFMIPS